VGAVRFVSQESGDNTVILTVDTAYLKNVQKQMVIVLNANRALSVQTVQYRATLLTVTLQYVIPYKHLALDVSPVIGVHSAIEVVHLLVQLVATNSQVSAVCVM
jgi:energy-converting hydrogenase A subunit M